MTSLVCYLNFNLSNGIYYLDHYNKLVKTCYYVSLDILKIKLKTDEFLLNLIKIKIIHDLKTDL